MRLDSVSYAKYIFPKIHMLLFYMLDRFIKSIVFENVLNILEAFVCALQI